VAVGDEDRSCRSIRMRRGRAEGNNPGETATPNLFLFSLYRTRVAREPFVMVAFRFLHRTGPTGRRTAASTAPRRRHSLEITEDV
jgi:hypothetical protein